MIKWKYNRKISTGVICASGTLGQIIPPSIVLVLLADIFQGANEEASAISGNLAPDPVSSIDLFAGAIFPGLLLVSFYFIWIFICSKLKPNIFPEVTKSQKTDLNILQIAKIIFPPIPSYFYCFGINFIWSGYTNRISFLGGFRFNFNFIKKRNINLHVILSASEETVKSVQWFSLFSLSFLFSLVFRGFGVI